jgi:hypothetical protein
MCGCKPWYAIFQAHYQQDIYRKTFVVGNSVGRGKTRDVAPWHHGTGFDDLEQSQANPALNGENCLDGSKYNGKCSLRMVCKLLWLFLDSMTTSGVAIEKEKASGG